METLSVRAQALSRNISSMLAYKSLTQSNQFDIEHNPNGIVNLGVAENHLCENELIDKLQSSQTWSKEFNYYPDCAGDSKFRQQLCSFFEDAFDIRSRALDPERIIISSGASGTISLLCFLIADPGDVFLVPSPYYTAFDFDVAAMAKNAIFQCPLLDQTSGNFRFDVEIFEHGFKEAINRGLRPRAIILTNPHNPLGDIYDESSIHPVLEFAAHKKLHVIMDELYALSVFNDEKPFKSILNYTSLPDRSRTHFLWSFSKDFALSGTRVGVVYAGTSELCTLATKLNFLMTPSSTIQNTLSSMLSDSEWTRAYIRLNRRRLAEKYQAVKRKIEKLDKTIEVRNTAAGLFLWINCRSLLHRVTFDEELRLFEMLFASGVYITNGMAFRCSEPGWFRLIFSVDDDWLEEGVKRINKALQTYRASPRLVEDSITIKRNLVEESKQVLNLSRSNLIFSGVKLLKIVIFSLFLISICFQIFSNDQ